MKNKLPLLIISFAMLVVLGLAFLYVSKLAKVSQKKPHLSWVESLPANEKKLFSFPSASTSDSERKKYSELLISQAVKTNTIHFGKDCKPTPLVSSIKANSTIQIVNDDGLTHKIVFDKTHYYTVSPNSSKTGKALLQLEKRYYTCDGNM